MTKNPRHPWSLILLSSFSTVDGIVLQNKYTSHQATDRVWSSAKKDVREETTVTTVGENAVAVAPTTKEEIKDRLHQKYIVAQKINKKGSMMTTHPTIA
jgi:hypothetical protein